MCIHNLYSKNKKNIIFFHMKIFSFLQFKNCSILDNSNKNFDIMLRS